LIICCLQDGTRVPFKVKKTTLFDKLFKAYCQKKALDQATLVFMNAEGQRVLPHQTPAEVILFIS
jgi:small ubiquitin-related modifier